MKQCNIWPGHGTVYSYNPGPEWGQCTDSTVRNIDPHRQYSDTIRLGGWKGIIQSVKTFFKTF